MKTFTKYMNKTHTLTNMNKMEYEEKSPNENKIKIIDKNTGQNPDA